MKKEAPYNPLDKHNLGGSVADAILQRSVGPLPPTEKFKGAGIYAIYYIGSTFEPYERIVELNRDRQYGWPIYVGKAVPEGTRKGGFGVETYEGNALFQRIREHAKSVDQADNLHLTDFRCRYLVVDDIWIPLGESLMIERFSPIWNKTIDGFGNHDPGKGRYGQQRSAWDILHPGRDWALKCTDNRHSIDEILATLNAAISAYIQSQAD